MKGQNVQVSNPSEEILLAIGIKPLVVEEQPAYDEEIQHLEPYYIDGETEITQRWRAVDAEVVEDEQAYDA